MAIKISNTTVINDSRQLENVAGGTLTGPITFAGSQTWPTFNQSTTGNAATATTLATARAINGISFNGSADITINAVDAVQRIASSEKGAVNGVATLDSGGKVPSTQLPSFVDDVLEFVNLAGFPVTGETGKIYVALDTNKTYRWSGTAYIYITSGAVDSVAGRTGVVTLTKADVGLDSVDNTSDATKAVLSATKLTTARTINSVSFDGSADITVADATKLPLAGGTLTGAVAFAAGQTWPTFNQSTTGNAATATTLATARTINGVSFNGSANITVADATKLPLAGGTLTGAVTFAAAQTWPTFNQNTTGNAATAATAVTATNLAGGSASAIPYQTSAGTTAFIGGGTSGQVLVSNGTLAPSWTSSITGYATLTSTQTLTNKTLTGVVFTDVVDNTGSMRSSIVAIAALDINCLLGNFFTKTISANSTFTFSNAPSSRGYAFTLELTHTSGTVTWPASVQWPGGTAPTLTTGKTHLFVFITDDGGTRWRGVVNANYTN